MSDLRTVQMVRFESEHPVSCEDIRKDERERFKLALTSDEAVEAANKAGWYVCDETVDGEKVMDYSFEKALKAAISAAEKKQKEG